MARVRNIVFLLLAGVLGVVLLQNMHEASLRFLFWNTQMPQIVLLTLTLFLGIAFGLFIGSQAGAKGLDRLETTSMGGTHAQV